MPTTASKIDNMVSFRYYLQGIDREKPYRATLTGYFFQHVPNLM